MTHSDTILTIKHVSKSFPGVKALDKINLELKRGEAHALLGENGAGKSTLVKIISGVYKRDEGDIGINGKACHFNSPKDAFNHGISIIHQETSLIPPLTVIQNVFLGIEYSKSIFNILDDKKILEKFNEICSKLNFDLPPNLKARYLNVAEQKMVEILKAMVHNALFIIMDEPTDSLAENEIERLFSIIKDLKKNNITILYITHYLDEVFKICDNLTVLRDGKKIDSVSTADVNQNDIIKMMIGQEVIEVTPSKQPANHNPPVIRIENLFQKNVINDVSFNGYQNEIIGITGVIGSGKTELAGLIFGATRPDSGAIYINETLCRIHSPEIAVRKGIGMLQEDRKNFGLLLEHEVYKNITLSALDKFTKNMIVSKKNELKKTSEMVRRLNIKITDSCQIVKYLSGGNQQKLVIGKWLVADPEILIMDEPTRGIDVGSKSEVYNIMRELADNGTCIIFISSEIPEIVKVSDKILVMKKGKIHSEYTRGVTQEEIIRALLEGNN